MVSQQVVALLSRVQFPTVSPGIEQERGSGKTFVFTVAEGWETEEFPTVSLSNR